jgi:hypothetical protein
MVSAFLQSCNRSILQFRGSDDESASVGEEDLRQVQDCPAPRRGAGDLLESEAQAATGVALGFSYELSE